MVFLLLFFKFPRWVLEIILRKHTFNVKCWKNTVFVCFPTRVPSCKGINKNYLCLCTGDPGGETDKKNFVFSILYTMYVFQKNLQYLKKKDLTERRKIQCSEVEDQAYNAFDNKIFLRTSEGGLCVWSVSRERWINIFNHIKRKIYFSEICIGQTIESHHHFLQLIVQDYLRLVFWVLQ